MTDIVVSRYGREFEFPEGTSEEVQNKRIANWMKQNAAAELEQDTPAPEGRSFTRSAGKVLSQVADGLRITDKNLYRTLAQGALPFADEITAGVRSILPGQPDYETALQEERQGIKDYGEKYGEFDKIATELGGAALGTIATLPVAAAARGVQGIDKVARWLMANPWKGSALTGATAGGIAGFGAGEGGLGNRLATAASGAGVGAALGPAVHAGVKGVENIGSWAGTNNRVADMLRRRMLSEREGLATSTTLPRTRAGNIDAETSEFTDAAMRDIRGELNDQRTRLHTNPMLADLLPAATEQVLLKRGPQTEQLARTMAKRQYDWTAPENIAAGFGQRGRVEDAFDLAFGADAFKNTDEQLLASMKANAKRLFDPAYAQNIRTAEIDDALDRIRTLNPEIWKQAKKWADSERRSIGAIDVTGDLRSYNTQFLHDIKRAMDESLGEAGRANPRFNDRPYLDAKIALNNAMKEANPEYKIAMEQYGDDAALLSALKKGREEAFPKGSVDETGGMKGEDIRAFLSDPNITQAEKDLFRMGAARALRERTLASNSKKFTHNWADFVNNPETEARMNALLTDRMGSWDLLRAKLKKESENFKGFNKAVGNSRTSAREEMKADLEGNRQAARIFAGSTNPGAFGALQAAFSTAMNKIDPATKTANRVADILGRTGAKGNRSALREVEALLRAQDARRDMYDRLGAWAPAAAAYAFPYREESF